MNVSLNTELAYEYKLKSNEIFILMSMAEKLMINEEPKNVHCYLSQGKLYAWITRDEILQNVKFLNISKSRLSHILGDLKKKGFVEYIAEPEIDGSKTYYRLTDKTYKVIKIITRRDL